MLLVWGETRVEYFEYCMVVVLVGCIRVRTYSGREGGAFPCRNQHYIILIVSAEVAKHLFCLCYTFFFFFYEPYVSHCWAKASLPSFHKSLFWANCCQSGACASNSSRHLFRGRPRRLLAFAGTQLVVVLAQSVIGILVI